MGTVTMIPATKRVGNALRKEAQPKKLKVAAYCRVSTDSDEQATSYDAQIEHYTEFIGKNPAWEMAGVYADDGISGTDTRHREEFNRMIDDAMAGRIDMIVSKSISRFARNTLDCLRYIRILKDKNIRSVEDNVRRATGQEGSYSLRDLSKKIMALQRVLVKKVSQQDDYDDIAEQIQRLQAEKAQRDSDLATRKRDAQSFQNIHDFVHSLGKEITEFDEKLVRRLVDRITVSDEAIIVTFKSGIRVEIKG